MSIFKKIGIVILVLILIKMFLPSVWAPIGVLFTGLFKLVWYVQSLIGLIVISAVVYFIYSIKKKMD